MIKNLLAVLVLSVGLLNVLAQETPKARDDYLLDKNIVSDVLVSDIKATSSDRVISGSFSLRSNHGSVENVVYGVLVSAEGKGVVASQQLGKEALLSENQTVLKNFSYRLPGYVQGKVQVALLVVTRDGLPLGRVGLLTKNLGKGGTELSCKHTSISIASSTICSVDTDELFKISSYRHFFDDDIVSKTVNSLNGKITIPEESYISGFGYIEIQNTKTLATIILPTFLDKPFAKIQGVMLDAKDGQVISHISSTFNALTKPELLVTFKDSKGLSCGSTSTQAVLGVTLISITSSCTAGFVEVTFTNNEQSLDTFTTSFNTLPFDMMLNNRATITIPVSPMHNKVYFTLIGFFFLIFSSCGFLWFKKSKVSKKIVTPVPVSVLVFFFLGSFFSGVVPSHALVVNWNTGSPFWSASASVNTDKGSYSPGEVVNVSMEADIIQGWQGQGSGSFGISDVGGGNGPGGTHVSVSFHSLETAAAPNGLKSHAVTYGGGGGCAVACGGAFPSGGTSVTYTVATPAPTVHLYFSFFRQLRSFFVDSLVDQAFASNN